ncbi:MAG: MFS transporter [Alphaproteobacteria bacterium]|jgi:predicted MFS family arabinose efflux permease|nr:MFS transporter [Alphaproteobacteria bacterium]MBT5160956.1 MFS transporter [Alphaproteobacteria bacterium]MBT6387839.1 MFS transporter [Alphaproteobacteria bacterium]
MPADQSADVLARKPFWRAVWFMLLCGGLVLTLAIGIRQTFGLFQSPMMQDLGWGRETFALMIGIQNLVWGLTQPIAGALADRFGAGRTVAISALIYGAGIYLMGQASDPASLHISGGLLIGMGLSGTSFGVVLSAVNRVVAEEKRSLALGLVGAAGSLGQFTMVPMGQAFITAYGWPFALTLLASISMLIIPLAAGVAGKAPVQSATTSQTVRESLAEAFHHRGYWLLIGGFFVCGFHVTFIGTHLPAFLTDQGLAASIAALALSLVGLFNIFGSLGCGWLGGRYPKKYVLATLYALRSVVIMIFILFPVTPFTALLFAACIGLLWLATVPLTTGLVGTLFGPQHLGLLFGIVFFSHQIGSFLGVWLGGYLYDATGSYDAVWWAAVALGLLAAILHWPIEERAVERPTVDEFV